MYPSLTHYHYHMQVISYDYKYAPVHLYIAIYISAARVRPISHKALARSLGSPAACLHLYNRLKTGWLCRVGSLLMTSNCCIMFSLAANSVALLGPIARDISNKTLSFRTSSYTSTQIAFSNCNHVQVAM